MKIEVTLEVDERLNTRNTRNTELQRRAVLNWAEKNHYGYASIKIVVDGDTAMDWSNDGPTPRELEAMRSEVVTAAVMAEMGEKLGEEQKFLNQAMQLGQRHKRLGPHFQAVLDDYKANPDSEWAKRHRKNAKARVRKHRKSLEQHKDAMAAREVEETKKQDLIRNMIDDEIARQDVIRSNGFPGVDDHRIKVMVEARLEGSADEDPTPQNDEERKMWERICRSAEAQAMFKLPTRFYLVNDGVGGRRSLSFDF